VRDLHKLKTFAGEETPDRSDQVSLSAWSHWGLTPYNCASFKEEGIGM
jgi:hypothetical protein